MSQGTKAQSVPSPLVALAAWLVPGAGHYLIGQRARGMTIGITILLLFVLGLLIGGAKVVEVPSYANGLRDAVMQRPWFVGQVLIGPVSILTASIARGDQFLASHARLNEIGTLYTAVAGMLNLLAIVDSTYRAARTGERS